MIRNIVFDLGGVLLDIDLNFCLQRVKALGVDFDAFSKQGEAVEKTGVKPAVMGEGLVANGVLHLYQVGGISTEAFLAGVQRACRPGTTREEVLEAWNSCCIDIPKYRLEKVKELKERGYTICMLSNTNDAHWQDIRSRCFGGQEVVDGLFDHVFLSQEMHMAKPNDDIFMEVLRQIGAKAEDCLFIDDSTANLEAAAALGFHTLHADISKTRDGKVVAGPERDWTDEIEKSLPRCGL